MTIHSFYTHNCIKCDAFYIPYEENLPCPKCGNIVKESVDFIELAADSALFNLHTVNSYMPGGWMMNSFGDRVLLTLFQILDAYTVNIDKMDFRVFAKDEILKINFGDQQYLVKHIYAISVLVYNKIQELNKSKD